MDERQIGLALALRELGVQGDVGGFDSRLILQKTVYLLEEAGIRLGYPFNWYLRGPYSPALTRDLFGLPTSNSDIDDWVLDEHSKQIAEKLRPVVAARQSEDQAATSRRLELTASLHYLARRGRLSIEDPDEAVRQLAQNGKHFSSEQVAAAIGDLQRVKLL